MAQRDLIALPTGPSCPCTLLNIGLFQKQCRPPPPPPQASLLHRLGWSVRLSLATEVAPCRALLFSAPRPGSLLESVLKSRPGAAATAAAGPAREPPALPWAAQLQGLCQALSELAAAAKASAKEGGKRRRCA